MSKHRETSMTRQLCIEAELHQETTGDLHQRLERLEDESSAVRTLLRQRERDTALMRLAHDIWQRHPDRLHKLKHAYNTLMHAQHDVETAVEALRDAKERVRDARAWHESMLADVSRLTCELQLEGVLPMVGALRVTVTEWRQFMQLLCAGPAAEHHATDETAHASAEG